MSKRKTKHKRKPKMSEQEIARRQQVMRNLVEEVTQYFRVFARPMPQKIAAGKYNRALAPYGGWRQIIDELTEDGTVKKLMAANGSIFLAPKSMRGSEWNGAKQVS